MRFFFSTIVFLNAFLLFLVQPMVARILLPSFGGAAQVWTVTMLFFQVLLLGGYAYADRLGRLRRWQGSVWLHPLFVFLALFFLPHLPGEVGAAISPSGRSPVLALLLSLGELVGVPFLVLSAGSSLLQLWYHRIVGARGEDPYRLFVASNAGSLVALVAYPLLIEPRFALHTQLRLWNGLFVALFVGVVACAGFSRRGVETAQQVSGSSGGEGAPGGTRFLWILLAAVPSSLLLGVTQHVTEDLGSVPLFWIVPFALYLVTFMFAFSPRRRVAEAATPFGDAELLLCLVVMALPMVLGRRALWMLTGHLALFFVVALRCHMTLVRLRPDPSRLTSFYLHVALGGALGGLFNGVLAPFLFDGLAEYPLALVLALSLRVAHGSAEDSLHLRARERRGKAKKRRGEAPAPPSAARIPSFAVGLVTAVVAAGMLAIWGHRIGAFWLRICLVTSFVSCWLLRRRLPFLVAMVSIWAFAGYHSMGSPRMLERRRSFYGVHSVLVSSDGQKFELVHGNTVHGAQRRAEPSRRVPLTYYHPTGPVGEILQSEAAARRGLRVAVVGMGNGSLAAYGREGQTMVFFEIDPLVVDLATRSSWFDFLVTSKAKIEIVVGDGRIGLAATAPGTFDVVVMDAFSSDSVPAHLLTVECAEVCLARLRSGGILLYNVSSRHLDFLPLLAALGRRTGRWMAFREEDWIDEEERAFGKLESTWCVFAENEESLRRWVLRADRWQGGGELPKVRPWTDDHVDFFCLVDPFSTSRSHLILRDGPSR